MLNLMKKFSDHGFTIIEALLASGIFLLILGTIYSSYIAGYDLWDAARIKTDLQAETRRAVYSMVAELRNATRTSTHNPSPNLSIPSPPNNQSIQFYLPADIDGDGYITDATGDIEWNTDNTIRYQYMPDEKVLLRFDQNGQRVIVRNVSDIQFIDITMDNTLFLDELRLILTLTKYTPKKRTISFTLSAVVKLRN